MAETRVVRFCTQVGSVKSWHMLDETSQMGCGYGHLIHLNFGGPSDTSERLKIESSYFVFR